LEIYGYKERFRGFVYDRKGRVLSGAAAGISRVLCTGGKRPKLDTRLLRLLVQISDAFGGRAIRIVSGYRSTSFFQDSRHKQSQAIDFSIPGVPNSIIRDYLRTLSKVGVGYYPNSSFVHLDAREYAAYWVDYAGPGEAPRRRSGAVREAEEVREEEPADVPDGPSHDDVLRAAPDSPAAPHPGSLPEHTDHTASASDGS
jgi:hypothetical protein